MPGLWKNQEGTREGKYLVQRRDGTVPEWPHFVIAAADPAAPAALEAYAQAAYEYGMDAEYVEDVRNMAFEFVNWRAEHGTGDPDAPRHREDDPRIIELMKKAKGA